MKNLVWLLVFPFAPLVAEGITIAPREPTPQEKADAAQKLRRMAADLRQTHPAKFKAAAEALAATGDERALKHLQDAYPRVDAVRRRVLLQTIGQMKPVAVAESVYVLSLKEPYLGLRRTAAEVLALIEGQQAAAQRYVKALTSPDSKLNALGRQRALQLLAHIGGRPVADNVRPLLNDTDAQVVIAACEAVSVMRDVDSVPALIEVLARRHVETAPSAQETLERITGQRLGGNLVKWRQWWQDRQVEQADAKNDGYGDDKYVPDYGQPHSIPLAESPVDFVVVYDTTGSLGKLWPEVSMHIDGVLAEMAKRCHSLRLGTVRYRAENANRSRYAVQPFPLTRDLKAARDNVMDASFGGGSGGLHLGLRHAISAFQWRAHARKAVLIVGDVTPKGEGLKACLKVIYEARELDQIYFSSLFIRSLHGDEHRSSYAQVAALGAGRFYEYDRGWRRLVDRNLSKEEAKHPEQALEILKKLMTPFVRESMQPK